MSYILEALQKSEHARQRGKVPDLNTVPVMPIPTPGPRTGHRLVYVLAGAAVLALIAVLAWLRPWQAPAPVVVTVPAERVAGEARAQDSAPAPQPRAADERLVEPFVIQRPSTTDRSTPAPATGAAPPGVAVFSSLPAPTPAPAIEPDARIAPTPRADPAMTAAESPPSPPAPLAAPVTTPPATTVARVVPAPVKAAASPRVAAAVVSPPVAPQPASVRDAVPSPARIYRRTELPDAIRSSLPALKVSGHAYAEQAAERMAVINDRLVQEGDEAAPGVTVAHIDSDGLVLVFRGYRFRP